MAKTKWQKRIELNSSELTNELEKKRSRCKEQIGEELQNI